jgi:hypothetical protein
VTGTLSIPYATRFRRWHAVPLVLVGGACGRDTPPPVTAIDVTNLIGVVAVVDSGLGRDSIRFLDVDGSLWYLFSFYYDDSDGLWDFPNEDFRPLAFHPDHFLLRLGVTRRDSLGYEVVVNKETGATRRLPSAPFLQFRTWEEHVLSVFSLEFDSRTNPVRTARGDSAPTIAYPGQEVIYRPEEINGEWVRVTWEVGPTPQMYSGWIRWKRGNFVVVRFHYFA